MSNPLFFIGTIFDKAPEVLDTKEKEIHFTQHELQNLDFTGLPIHYEHYPDTKVGVILMDFFDEKDGSKRILGRIDDETFIEKTVASSIETRTLPELSISHRAFSFTMKKRESEPTW